MTQLPFFEYIASGRYWPALAVALLAATYLLRRAGADAALGRMIGAADDTVIRWLRPWLPILLSVVAFAVACASGAVETAEAAAQSLAAAVAAMAGHDAGQAVLALARSLMRRPPAPELTDEEPGRKRHDDALPPLGNRMQRAIRARAMIAGPMLAALLPLAMAATGCVRPQSRPMAAYSVNASASGETLAECRKMRDRSMATAAGSAAAGALAGGLGAVALPVDRDGLKLGLGVSSAVTAALGAGLALLSHRYGSALDEHCDPWPAAAARVPLEPLDKPAPLPAAVPVTLLPVAEIHAPHATGGAR